MNQVLNHDWKDLENRKALITAQEIQNQPKVWMKLACVLENRKQELGTFMNKVLGIPRPAGDFHRCRFFCLCG